MKGNNWLHVCGFCDIGTAALSPPPADDNKQLVMWLLSKSITLRQGSGRHCLTLQLHDIIQWTITFKTFDKRVQGETYLIYHDMICLLTALIVLRKFYVWFSTGVLFWGGHCLKKWAYGSAMYFTRKFELNNLIFFWCNKVIYIEIQLILCYSVECADGRCTLEDNYKSKST